MGKFNSMPRALRPESDRWLIFFCAANKCNPAEKVPKSWCFKQFYNMCRNSKTKNATVLARYGGGGCQQWQLLRKNAASPG